MSFQPKVSIRCILTAAAFLCCAGCGRIAGSDQTSTTNDGSSVSVVAESAVQPEASSETQTDAQPWEPEQAVTVLSSFSASAVPSMADLGDGRVFCCWTDFATDGEDCGTGVCIVDLATDAVEDFTFFDQYLEYERMFPDGSVLFTSYIDGCFYLMDEAFTLTRLNTPDTDGQFSSNRSLYYYEKDGALYALNLATGEETCIPLEDEFRIASLGSICADEDYLFCWVLTSLYSYAQCMALVDTANGNVLLLDPDLSDVGCVSNSFYSLEWVPDTEDCQLFYGALHGDDPLHRYTISADEDTYFDVTLLPYSDYVFSTIYTWTEDAVEAEEVSSRLYRMNADGNVEVADLEETGLQYTPYSFVYLPEQNLIVVGFYADDSSRMAILDLEQLTFFPAGQAEEVSAAERIDSETLAAYQAELAPVALPDTMSDARAKADELEETYSVHILLGAQCAGPCDASEFDVTTTDEIGLADECADVLAALEELESALVLYPSDFFARFQTENGEDGIYFLLTGAIGSDRNMDVAGFEYGMESREYICVDITEPNYALQQNFCHELWHATENKIFDTDFYGFYDGSWDACNPEGFEYYYSYDYLDYAEDAQAYTYFGGAEEVYFVDSYAQSYDKEDRARIMEYIMTDDDTATALMAYPAMQQKLQIMCDGINEAFDTENWTDVRWEQYLDSTTSD
ncbi:MAG: hypothetical protein LIO78_03065 [Clostridiales bacterium]|nr:hypothetical protein [Clostridiales bacterium]